MDDCIIPLKTCKVCGQEFPETTEYFHKAKKTLSATCIMCRRAAAKKWAQENPEKVKASKAKYRSKPETKSKEKAASDAYYLANKERENERSRIYHAENAEKIRRRKRENYKADIEASRLANRRRYANNIEQYRATERRYRSENPEKMREISKRWRKRNLDKDRAKSQRRRARLKGAEGSHTEEDVKNQIKSQTNNKGQLVCWWCGEPIPAEYHVDHRIPLVKGGSNNPDNLVIAHPLCNSIKKDRMPWDFNGRLL